MMKRNARQAGWQSLETLLKDVHQRPSDYAPEQIEAEIGLARRRSETGTA